MCDLTLCTATNCTYANKCYRHTQGDPDNPYQSWANLEFTCHEYEGFSSFIPIHNSDKK